MVVPKDERMAVKLASQKIASMDEWRAYDLAATKAADLVYSTNKK